MTAPKPDYARDGITLYCADCRDILPHLSGVDAVVTDPPYGTTYAEWDKCFEADFMWDQFRRILAPGGAVVLTASQPFTSAIVMSNPEWFRTEWIWDKCNPTNFANAKRHPMKVHESVLVFGPKQTTYNPQMTAGKPNHKQGRSTTNHSETRLISGRSADDLSGMKYPKSIQVFPKHSSQCGLHPTQKPVDLMDYFVRTYTNETDVVLDPFMGSGTTGVACRSRGRRFIGIEQEQRYFDVAVSRIEAESKMPAKEIQFTFLGEAST